MNLPTDLLLVVNQHDKTVSVIDPLKLEEIAVIDEGQAVMHGHEVAASSRHQRAFVPIYSDVGVAAVGADGHEMLVIDTNTFEITEVVEFGHGVRPHGVIYEPVRNLLYVTTELDDTITVVDPETLLVVATIPTGQEQSHMIAVTQDGKRGYVANIAPGSVSVLDLEARKLVTIILVADCVQRIAVSPDGKWVFTSDTDLPRLAAIDTERAMVSKWIDLPGRGFGSAATPDGKWLLVPVPEKHLVAVIDLDSLEVSRTIPVVDHPQEMLVRPDGRFAYVAGASVKKVAVIDLARWEMTATVDVGNYPDGLAWVKSIH